MKGNKTVAGWHSWKSRKVLSELMPGRLVGAPQKVQSGKNGHGGRNGDVQSRMVWERSRRGSVLKGERVCGKINFGSKRKKKQECRLSNRKEGGAFAGSREGSGCRGNGQERLRFGGIR